MTKTNFIYIRTASLTDGGKPTSKGGGHRVGAIAYRITDTKVMLSASVALPIDRKVADSDPGVSADIAVQKLRAKVSKKAGGKAVVIPVDRMSEKSIATALTPLRRALKAWNLTVDDVVAQVAPTIKSDYTEVIK